jgi:hypothetical protein
LEIDFMARAKRSPAVAKAPDTTPAPVVERGKCCGIREGGALKQRLLEVLDAPEPVVIDAVGHHHHPARGGAQLTQALCSSPRAQQQLGFPQRRFWRKNEPCTIGSERWSRRSVRLREV